MTEFLNNWMFSDILKLSFGRCPYFVIVKTLTTVMIAVCFKTRSKNENNG